MPFFTFNSNTKMALRAVVVGLLCILVTHTFEIERAYWVFLTGFMLITQSFGDGIYRSLIRFIMTIIGCLTGWVIYLPIQHHPTVLMLTTLLALFFMLYWFTTSIIGRNLATGILLVTSFGMMNGGWTFMMLLARIQDTFIGAAIAILVNGLILPEFSKTNVQKTFLDLRCQLIKLAKSLQTQRTLAHLKSLQKEVQALEKERLTLSQDYQLSRYEILFNPRKKKRYKTMLIQTNLVFVYLNALSDLKISALSKRSTIKKELAKSGSEYYQARLRTELTKLTAI